MVVAVVAVVAAVAAAAMMVSHPSSLSPSAAPNKQHHFARSNHLSRLLTLHHRKERRQWTNPNHIIPSMAETRAKSRAISDLLGVGDAKE